MPLRNHNEELPRIYRQWYGAYGKFYWAVRPLKVHWGSPASIHLRKLHDKAWRWCHQQNSKV